MNKAKLSIITAIIIISIFAVLSISPLCYATEYEITHYSYSNGDASHTFKGTHPSADGNWSAFFQNFAITTPTYITRAVVTAGKAGAPTGYLVAEIRGTNDSYLTGIPTGSLYATSNQLDFSDVTGTNDLHSFSFPYNSSAHWFEAGNYSLVVYIYGVVDASANWIESLYDNTASGYSGSAGEYYSSAWAVGTTHDIPFYLYGDLTAVETPGPLPTGGLNVDTSDADEVMEALIGYGVPVVVMLLPMIFIWLVGGRGKWPMLLGISIGTGIGYLFGLVPVWLVFMVSIGVVGFAYQSVRSGN